MNDMYLDSVLELTQEPIWICDIRAGATRVNEPFRRFWALPHDYFSSGPEPSLIEFLAQQIVDPAQFRARIEARDGIPLKAAGVLNLKDGRIVEYQLVPQIREGLLAGYICSFRDVTDRRQAESRVREYLGKLKSALQGSVNLAIALSEMRDPYTSQHAKRVSAISLAICIAGKLGFDADRVEGLGIGASLHDVGKIAVPAEILAKPTRLTAAEYTLVKIHPQAGYDVLKGVEFPWPVARIAHQHHERMDGSGYPNGLSGEDILLEARIVAVADVVEAMTSHRPYRPAMGVDKALHEIESGRGSRYDAQVVDACLSVFREGAFQPVS